MEAEEVVRRFTGLLMPVLNENGFRLVKAEYVKESGNYFLRAYIDRDGGISINDCALVSRVMSKKMDREDFIEEAYTMEVCSPGFLNSNPEEKNSTEENYDNGGQ